MNSCCKCPLFFEQQMC